MRTRNRSLVALEFFASSGPGNLGQSFEFPDDSGQHAIRQRFEFLPRGRLYLDGIAIRAGARV